MTKKIFSFAAIALTLFACSGSDSHNDPIVSSSSSNIAADPSSSSGDANNTTISSSSGTAILSSSSTPIPNCAGFIEGTKREHQGKNKEQFCDPRDGTKYVYVNIGSQTWMAENLKYNAKGSKCGNGNDNSLNDANTATCDTYGRVYNWSTAMNGVCPEGWHLPSDAEWTTLTNSVGGETTAGTKLKANSPLWNSNGKGTDDYGFSALPGGRYYSGTFGGVGFYGDWWSATEYNGSAYSRDMFYGGDVHRASSDKTDLYSVRCVRDKSNGFVEPSSSSGYAPIEISNFTFSDIKYWIGTGENMAMLIVQWNDGKKPEALAYGYRWKEGQNKSGNDMIIDIAKADKRLFYLKYSSAIGAIGGIGFSASGEAKIGIDGSCQSPVNGSVETPSYNFDSWKICNGADARWFAGWDNGFWSYWTSENANSVLNYSEVEPSLRVLKNKSIDTWNAAPGFSQFPLSAITPVNSPDLSCVESFTDSRDSKTYKCVKIGTQIWMAENLNYDVPSNDTDVCYGNDPANCTTYGRLYDWETATDVCPAGWHLPSDAEWTTLTTSVGANAGTQLKADSPLWNSGRGTDDHDFSA